MVYLFPWESLYFYRRAICSQECRPSWLLVVARNKKILDESNTPLNFFRTEDSSVQILIHSGKFSFFLSFFEKILQRQQLVEMSALAISAWRWHWDGAKLFSRRSRQALTASVSNASVSVGSTLVQCQSTKSETTENPRPSSYVWWYCKMVIFLCLAFTLDLVSVFGKIDSHWWCPWWHLYWLQFCFHWWRNLLEYLFVYMLRYDFFNESFSPFPLFCNLPCGNFRSLCVRLTVTFRKPHCEWLSPITKIALSSK